MQTIQRSNVFFFWRTYWQCKNDKISIKKNSNGTHSPTYEIKLDLVYIKLINNNIRSRKEGVLFQKMFFCLMCLNNLWYITGQIFCYVCVIFYEYWIFNQQHTYLITKKKTYQFWRIDEIKKDNRLKHVSSLLFWYTFSFNVFIPYMPYLINTFNSILYNRIILFKVNWIYFMIYDSSLDR